MVGLLLVSTPALGDDTLHDGQVGSVGIRTDRSVVTQLRSDLAIFPFPGGPDVWGGPINATRVDVTLTGSADGVRFEQGRAQFIRWPHLHVLGIERDTTRGTAVGAELAGFYLPAALWGNIGARQWAIATVGADLGYRHQLTRAGAQRAGHLGYMTASGQVEIQHQLGERVELRGFGEVAYTFAAGQLEGPGQAWEQLFELAGGIGLYWDINFCSPTRRVPRTDPATGEVTYRTVANEGRRWRVIVLDVGAAVRPFDSISTGHPMAIFKTGLSHEY